MFPELREWCFKRNLDLIECDLRWGVPVDSTSEDTILTCLTELDRCFEENDGQPFFIGMLSEKYGWVPEMSKLLDQIKMSYGWVPKVSITFMEFLHGALRSNDQNSCFFIRSQKSLEGVPKEYHDKFYEADAYSKLQLEVLKEKLRYYHGDRVFEYDCRYEGVDESTGRKKVKLGGLEEFGQKALKFLKEAIERSYPDFKPVDESSIEIVSLSSEDSMQSLYVIEKTSFFVGYEKEINSIIRFLDSAQISDDITSIGWIY